ncbi:hypothetical protein [Rhizobium leguminosarum]|uniref:hypothetical protein n=1 Tax=Rhizobium leguminosarum TaxID=384 RepID=UPI003F9C907C
MPTSHQSDESLPKSSIEPQDLAKEFSDDSTMDDSDAFHETKGADDFQALEDTPNWRPAKSLKQLQAQVNQAFPNRKKASDGMIGNSAHCPGTSDHCANIVDNGVGVVTAFDITHDPNSGCDMERATNAVVTSQDPRIKYIIYNHRICSSYPHGGVAAWTWRPYSGSNAHEKHAHFSVVEDKARYDDTRAWSITGIV